MNGSGFHQNILKSLNFVRSFFFFCSVKLATGLTRTSWGLYACVKLHWIRRHPAQTFYPFLDRAGWQAKVASIECWIPWRDAHSPHFVRPLKWPRRKKECSTGPQPGCITFALNWESVCFSTIIGKPNKKAWRYSWTRTMLFDRTYFTVTTLTRTEWLPSWRWTLDTCMSKYLPKYYESFLYLKRCLP